MLKRYKRWCYKRKKNIEKFYILDDPSFNKFLILSVLNPYQVITLAAMPENWPRGYKTFIMLSSAETKICPAYKC